MPHKYDLTVSPTADADVPDGDGYHLHNSLTNGEDAFDTLSVSMLMDGPFRAGDEPHTKRVFADEDYTLRLAVTDDREVEALDDLLAPVTDGPERLDLDGTEFEVTDVDRTATTMDDLWTRAVELTTGDHPEVELTFNTPTCVVHPNSTITEMFPHRRSIFPQLAAAWNRALVHNDAEDGDRLKFALDPFEVGSQVFEKPDTRAYRTYSTLTDVRTDASGDEMPFFRQGYIGSCVYAFRNADEHIVETVVALALFAEYSGVGVDTNHGCGCVTTTVTGRGGRR